MNFKEITLRSNYSQYLSSFNKVKAVQNPNTRLPTMKLFAGLLVASSVALASDRNQSSDLPGTLFTFTSLGNYSLPIPSLVTLGTGVIGGLLRPNSHQNPVKAKIGVLVMHAEQDYTTFYPCSELPVRGYTTLCLNNAQSKIGLMNVLNFETMMIDVGVGVQYLNDLPGIDQVVL
ncbi:unnamed protein product [Penicillium pancosmium]